MKKITKGYKAFEFDWTCRGKNYGGPGKATAQKGELNICKSGIHCCEKMADVLKYYPLLQSYKYAEIEAYGRIKKASKDSKFCASEIKIVRELTFNEVIKLLTKELRSSTGVSDSTGVSFSTGVSSSTGVRSSAGVSDSTGVSFSTGVRSSAGVSDSTGVSFSAGVRSSDGVSFSDGVCSSAGVSDSYGVSSSTGVRSSAGVSDSTGVSFSTGVRSSAGVSDSTGVRSSTGVSDSTGVSFSTGVRSSTGVSDSYGVKKCDGVSHALFCANLPKVFRLFNKEISERRYHEVKQKIGVLVGDWRPAANNHKELYLLVGSDWDKVPLYRSEDKTDAEMYSDMPKALIEYLKSLPEFDAKIFKEITGKKA